MAAWPYSSRLALLDDGDVDKGIDPILFNLAQRSRPTHQHTTSAEDG
jgi:hypothetical protein